MLKISQREMLN